MRCAQNTQRFPVLVCPSSSIQKVTTNNHLHVLLSSMRASHLLLTQPVGITASCGREFKKLITLGIKKHFLLSTQNLLPLSSRTVGEQVTSVYILYLMHNFISFSLSSKWKSSRLLVVQPCDHFSCPFLCLLHHNNNSFGDAVSRYSKCNCIIVLDALIC